MKQYANLKVYTRTGKKQVEAPFEKPVIMPKDGDNNPGVHAWTDARFATDIMAEHGLFFALLMPPEVASKERAQALKFSQNFTKLNQKIDETTPPDKTSVKSFVSKVIEEIKPFIEYKYKQHEAQTSGKLRSLVWPLLFEHTRKEAERWVKRLENLAKGESGFDKKEVVKFWNNIMDEHARFVAHLLDPDEFELIEKATKTSNVFKELNGGGIGGAVSATVKEPGIVTDSLIKNPEIDAVLSAAETILDFKTKAARDIEKAKIKSIIDPRLADHIRREALKFVDELKRS